MPVKSEIIDYLLQGSDERTNDIAARFGSSASYVSKIRSDLGRGRYGALPVMASRENREFVIAEAKKSGVTVGEMINAILDDARLEEHP